MLKKMFTIDREIETLTNEIRSNPPNRKELIQKRRMLQQKRKRFRQAKGRESMVVAFRDLLNITEGREVF